MNTDVSKQFRDQCSAIVVLTLRAGGFLRASVFYFSLIPRFSLSLCVRSGHAHLDSMGFKSLLMSFRKTERNSLLAWTAVIRVTPFFPSCWSCRFLPVWEFHHKLCSEGLSDAVKHHTLPQTQHKHTHIYKQRERVAVLKFITLGALIFSLGIWMHAQFMLHERAKCTPTVIPRSRASAESRVNAPIDTPVTFIRPIGTRVSEARGR